MVDMRAVYRAAEEHANLVIAGLVASLVLFAIAQLFMSPLAIVAAVIGIIFLVVTAKKPLWSIAFLAMYLPFEPLILKFTPDEIYLFARFFSELLVYAVAAVTLWLVVARKRKRAESPLDLPFVLFLLVLLASALINAVPALTAVLGARQILRFMVVFFAVIHLAPPKAYIRRLTYVMFAVAIVESAIGLLQLLIGAPLDTFLLPYAARSYGEITLTSGVVQFWDPGSRVFATLGRYDRLGNFLYFFLLIGAAFLYEKRIRAGRKQLAWLFALGLPALVMTFSRASWFAFVLGFLFIAVWIHRDRRVMGAFAAFVIIVSSYVAISGLNVRAITELPGQTLVERFYESFSATRWRGEYYGLGRVYWFVQTPLVVVPSSPFFGVGPGQYGGGAVSALHNTAAYDRLGLPFGVYGTDGYIDNNWFSLWGEAGTVGLAIYLWMYAGLFVYAIRLHRQAKDAYARAFALGFAAALIGVGFNAMTSTLLEIRTTAYYLWLYGGFLFVLGERARLKKPS